MRHSHVPFAPAQRCRRHVKQGELFFKSNARPAQMYMVVSVQIYGPLPRHPQQPVAQLPDMSGQAGKSLWTDGISTAWKNVTTGATGALALTQTGFQVSLDIVPAVIPQKTAANVFTGLNTFGFGIQLSPQAAPADPENGRIWYDSTLHKFRCHQAGVTSDCISTGGSGSAQTIVGGSGIVVTNGDGVNGNPTIAASADLLNLTTPRSAATALMGPSSGSPGSSFVPCINRNGFSQRCCTVVVSEYLQRAKQIQRWPSVHTTDCTRKP